MNGMDISKNHFISIKDYTMDKINFQQAKQKVESFSHLQKNWDGYGGIATKEKIIDKSLDFIQLLENNQNSFFSDIFPNPNGTISFEWENKNEKLSLEIGEDNYSFFYKEKNENPVFENGTDIFMDFDLLEEYLKNL